MVLVYIPWQRKLRSAYDEPRDGSGAFVYVICASRVGIFLAQRLGISACNSKLPSTRIRIVQIMILMLSFHPAWRSYRVILLASAPEQRLLCSYQLVVGHATLFNLALLLLSSLSSVLARLRSRPVMPESRMGMHTTCEAFHSSAALSTSVT